jgi:hypothetical protein
MITLYYTVEKELQQIDHNSDLEETTGWKDISLYDIDSQTLSLIVLQDFHVENTENTEEILTEWLEYNTAYTEFELQKIINMNKTQIKAEIVADSLSPQGDRLTSLLITFPRFILAEVNTHRMLSKNTSSSRAIPFNKMVESVQNDPFIPIAWQKHHSGMQGNQYETDKGNILYLEHKWKHGLNSALDAAKRLNMSKVTKQLCNRLLEPFMWTTMLITGSKEGWDNFFELRCPQYTMGTSDGFYKSKKDLLKSYPS